MLTKNYSKNSIIDNQNVSINNNPLVGELENKRDEKVKINLFQNSNISRILKKDNEFNFETPKDKLKSKNYSKNSLLSLYPSSPTSPVGFTALNEKKEYQVLWSPSMETPILNRTFSRNRSLKLQSNTFTEQLIKNKINTKSKSLISFSKNASNELFDSNSKDLTSILNNKNTPKNNIRYNNSTLTTPDSTESNKNISKISEQSLLFKNVFSYNTYLSSPVRSQETPIPNHFRNLFYKDNSIRENQSKIINKLNSISLEGNIKENKNFNIYKDEKKELINLNNDELKENDTPLKNISYNNERQELINLNRNICINNDKLEKEVINNNNNNNNNYNNNNNKNKRSLSPGKYIFIIILFIYYYYY